MHIINIQYKQHVSICKPKHTHTHTHRFLCVVKWMSAWRRGLPWAVPPPTYPGQMVWGRPHKAACHLPLPNTTKNAHTHTHQHTKTHDHTVIHTCTHTIIHPHTHDRTHTHTHTWSYTHTRSYTQTHTQDRTYIIHTHTHDHTHKNYHTQKVSHTPRVTHNHEHVHTHTQSYTQPYNQSHTQPHTPTHGDIHTDLTRTHTQKLLQIIQIHKHTHFNQQAVPESMSCDDCTNANCCPHIVIQSGPKLVFNSSFSLHTHFKLFLLHLTSTDVKAT